MVWHALNSARPVPFRDDYVRRVTLLLLVQAIRRIAERGIRPAPLPTEAPLGGSTRCGSATGSLFEQCLGIPAHLVVNTGQAQR